MKEEYIVYAILVLIQLFVIGWIVKHCRKQVDQQTELFASFLQKLDKKNTKLQDKITKLLLPHLTPSLQ